MAWGPMGNEGGSTERDPLSVAQDSVDVDITSVWHHPPPPGDVLLHDHDLSSDELSEKDIGLLVIAMGVASQNDLDVLQVETECFDASIDEGNRSLEVRVDEDVPFRGRDQKRAQAPGAHEVKVVHDLMCRERIVPAVLRPGMNRGGSKDGQDQNKSPHVILCGLLRQVKESPRRLGRRGLPVLF